MWLEDHFGNGSILQRARCLAALFGRTKIGIAIAGLAYKSKCCWRLSSKASLATNDHTCPYVVPKRGRQFDTLIALVRPPSRPPR